MKQMLSTIYSSKLSYEHEEMGFSMFAIVSVPAVGCEISTRSLNCTLGGNIMISSLCGISKCQDNVSLINCAVEALFTC